MSSFVQRSTDRGSTAALPSHVCGVSRGPVCGGWLPLCSFVCATIRNDTRRGSSLAPASSSRQVSCPSGHWHLSCPCTTGCKRNPAIDKPRALSVVWLGLCSLSYCKLLDVCARSAIFPCSLLCSSAPRKLRSALHLSGRMYRQELWEYRRTGRQPAYMRQTVGQACRRRA